MNSQKMIQAAKSWRIDKGYVGKGGIIVLFKNKVQGWVNGLRDPQRWQPGCIAIDEAGNSWIASGGNDYDGANTWQTIPRPQA